MVEPAKPLRIGIVIVSESRLNETALRFLILAMNAEQRLFQFEFYNHDDPGSDSLLALLTGRGDVARASVRDCLPAFGPRFRQQLEVKAGAFGTREEPPERFVVISQSRFTDNHYSARAGGTGVIALGNWKRYMAPPSLLEFIQVLLLREAVAALCPSLSASVHLGNKGCLLDFTELLSEVRYKALRGFVCDFCGKAMAADGQPDLADVVTRLVDRAWMGTPSDPRSVAGIAANLGYNLFIAKGLKQSAREKFLATLQEEGAKKTATILVTAIAALVAVLLGVKLGG